MEGIRYKQKTKQKTHTKQTTLPMFSFYVYVSPIKWRRPARNDKPNYAGVTHEPGQHFGWQCDAPSGSPARGTKVSTHPVTVDNQIKINNVTETRADRSELVAKWHGMEGKQGY